MELNYTGTDWVWRDGGIYAGDTLIAIPNIAPPLTLAQVACNAELIASAPDLYEACKEGADNFKFEKHTSGRIEHWVDNNRGNKAFAKKEKLMMAQAIRDYLTFLEDRTLKSIKQAIAKAES